MDRGVVQCNCTVPSPTQFQFPSTYKRCNTTPGYKIQSGTFATGPSVPSKLGDKYNGAVLTPSGLVVFVPCSADAVAIYDPMTNTFTVGPSVGVHPSTEDKVAFFRRWGYLSVPNVLEGEALVNTQKAFTKHTKQLRDAWLAGKAGVPRRYFDLENFVELDRLFLDLGTRPSLYACAEAEAPTKFVRLCEEETKLPLKRRPTDCLLTTGHADWDAHCRSRQPGAI